MLEFGGPTSAKILFKKFLNLDPDLDYHQNLMFSSMATFPPNFVKISCMV